MNDNESVVCSWFDGPKHLLPQVKPTACWSDLGEVISIRRLKLYCSETCRLFWIVCACKVDQTIIHRLSYGGCNFESGVASDVRPDTRLVTLQLRYYCFHKTQAWNSALAELMKHRSSQQMAQAGVAPSSARVAPCPRNSRLSFNALVSRTRSASLSVRKSLPGGRTHQAAFPPVQLKFQSFAKGERQEVKSVCQQGTCKPMRFLHGSVLGSCAHIRARRDLCVQSVEGGGVGDVLKHKMARSRQACSSNRHECV